MKLSSLYTSPRMYTVATHDRGSGLALVVVVGGIAMYEVVIALSPEEEERFRSDGHLDDLAYQVARDPEAYGARTLRPIAPDEKLELD